MINATQIALPLSFDRQFSFDNYFNDRADFITASLKSSIESGNEAMIGLWGPADSGKTHLLNACAQYARERSMHLQLYDASLLASCDPEQFDNFAPNTVLAIDNLDAVCGNQMWEKLFYLIINGCRDQNMRFIFSLSNKPQDIHCQLPDFQSRLSWGLLLELPVPGDLEVGHIVSLRAQLLGMTLSPTVLSYLLNHYSRRLTDQIQILHQLDRASLSTQKKVTISLVKQVLEEAL